MMHLLALSILVAILGGADLPKAGSSLQDDYRAIVLVRTFDSPGLPEDQGVVAAESLAAALEARGLTRALRPRRIAVDEYGLRLDTIEADDVERGQPPAWSPRGIDVYWRTSGNTRYREVALPSDYVVTGLVSRVGETWSVRASLMEGATGRQRATAACEAKGEDGFFAAIREVAQGVEDAYRRDVIERRSEAALRRFRIREISRDEAVRRLDALHERWPDLLAPVAVRLLLSLDQEPPDPDEITTWAEKTVAMLSRGAEDDLQLVLRLGLDPYAVLAERYEASGRLEEAARVHRQATETFPLNRFPHLVSLARLEEATGKTEGAVRACREALRLRPEDASLQENLERLTSGKPGD